MVGLLGVDYLMVAAGDVAACYVLELLAGLEEEMAWGDRDWEFLAGSEPGEETWVSWFAMDCQEIKIVMIASKYGPYFKLLQITASRCQFMFSSIHHGDKNFPL